MQQPQSVLNDSPILILSFPQTERLFPLQFLLLFSQERPLLEGHYSFATPWGVFKGRQAEAEGIKWMRHNDSWYPPQRAVLSASALGGFVIISFFPSFPLWILDEWFFFACSFFGLYFNYNIFLFPFVPLNLSRYPSLFSLNFMASVFHHECCGHQCIYRYRHILNRTYWVLLSPSYVCVQDWPLGTEPVFGVLFPGKVYSFPLTALLSCW